MGIKNLMFGDIEIEKNEFHHYKNPIFLNAVNVDNIFISTNVSSGENKL